MYVNRAVYWTLFTISLKIQSFISSLRISGNVEVATDGIQNLAQSNSLNLVDDLGYTLLHWSALKGKFCTQKIDVLIKVNEFYYNFLIVGRNGIVELLIRNGADLNIKDRSQKTPIQKATENSN